MFIHPDLSQDRVPPSPTSRPFKQRHPLSPFTSRSTVDTYSSTPSSPISHSTLATEHHDHGLLSGARSLGRALAKFTKWEKDMPSSQGIDYFTFHALYRTSTERRDVDAQQDETVSLGCRSSPSIRSEARDPPSWTRSIQRTRSADALLSDEASPSTLQLLLDEDPAFRAKQRRAKFAKLTRHLGENIPPELVTQTPARSSTPLSLSPTPSSKKSKHRLTLHDLSPFPRPLPLAPPVEFIKPEAGDETEPDRADSPLSSTAGFSTRSDLPGKLTKGDASPTKPISDPTHFATVPLGDPRQSAEKTHVSGDHEPVEPTILRSPTFSMSSASVYSLASPPSSPCVELVTNTEDATTKGWNKNKAVDAVDHPEINDPSQYNIDLHEPALGDECSVLDDRVSFEMRRTRKLSHFFGVDLEVLSQSLQPGCSVGVAY